MTAAALPTVRASDLDDHAPEHAWLVDSLWARSAVGILGGAPKCCKSWLALDLALSVASGSPCLDRFPVARPAPVLLYMAEDAHGVVKDRLRGLCQHRGLSLERLAVDVITVPSLRLDLERDRDRLRETVRRVRPGLLVLDPFVRLHRLDENHAGDVSELLGALRALQREHDLAILVVHHARKNAAPGTAPGQGLRGSGDLHAWGDSNLYLRRQRGELLLSVEHRAAPAPQPVALTLVATPPEAVHLALASEAASIGASQPSLDELVLTTLRAEGPLRREQLRDKLRVRNERLGLALDRLERDGRLVRQRRTLSLVPASPS